uniref:Uncharacterized protein n=1 Tax=Manihot esculenta TaxID=3983 RepID=A0A2C9WIF2_MANES
MNKSCMKNLLRTYHIGRPSIGSSSKTKVVSEKPLAIPFSRVRCFILIIGISSRPQLYSFSS